MLEENQREKQIIEQIVRLSGAFVESIKDINNKLGANFQEGREKAQPFIEKMKKIQKEIEPIMEAIQKDLEKYKSGKLDSDLSIFNKVIPFFKAIKEFFLNLKEGVRIAYDNSKLEYQASKGEKQYENCLKNIDECIYISDKILADFKRDHTAQQHKKDIGKNDYSHVKGQLIDLTTHFKEVKDNLGKIVNTEIESVRSEKVSNIDKVGDHVMD